MPKNLSVSHCDDEFKNIWKGRMKHSLRSNRAESDAVPAKIQKLIVVLSMHRSGSSLTTKALTVFGADLGNNLIPADAGNLTGYWEDRELVSLNKQMLRHLGLNWYSLRRVTAEDCHSLCTAGFDKTAKDYLSKLKSRGEIVAIKDPRTAKLLKFWMPIFKHSEFDLEFVVPLRHPAKVANSLARRDEILLRHGKHLWLDYMMSIVTYSERCKCCFIDFDALVSDPKSQLRHLSHKLGLPISQNEGAAFTNEFIRPELNGYAPSEPEDLVDYPLNEIYDHFSSASAGNESADLLFEGWQKYWDSLQPENEMADALMQIAMRGQNPYPKENQNFFNLRGWRRWPALFQWGWKQTVRRLRKF